MFLPFLGRTLVCCHSYIFKILVIIFKSFETCVNVAHETFSYWMKEVDFAQPVTSLESRVRHTADYFTRWRKCPIRKALRRCRHDFGVGVLIPANRWASSSFNSTSRRLFLFHNFISVQNIFPASKYPAKHSCRPTLDTSSSNVGMAI